MGRPTIEPGAFPLDLRLLEGFRFRCRPDCALCCYAEPVVGPTERAELVQLVPEAEFVERARATFVRSAPHGGACGLLADHRCRVHAARPAPCREYPIAVHLGERAQATIVLSCPGVELAPLTRVEAARSSGGPDGFDGELASVRRRITPEAGRRRADAVRRRRRVVRLLEDEGRWEDDETVRRAWRDRLPLPGPADFPAEDPPPVADGPENLPLVFAGRPGPVALAAGLGGWELRELRPAGGEGTVLAVVPPPDRPPAVSDAGAAVLRGYLRYWLERDALFAAVHVAMLDSEGGTVREWIAEELRSIGALVLARAAVLAAGLSGRYDRLDRAEIEGGIRATDQDLLDRPTWGGWL